MYNLTLKEKNRRNIERYRYFFFSFSFFFVGRVGKEVRQQIYLYKMVYDRNLLNSYHVILCKYLINKPIEKFVREENMTLDIIQKSRAGETYQELI